MHCWSLLDKKRFSLHKRDSQCLKKSQISTNSHGFDGITDIVVVASDSSIAGAVDAVFQDYTE